MLELKATHDKWKPWVSLRPSTLKSGGIGVFAERQFERNTPLGFYIGECIWQSKITGGSKPSNEYLEAQGVSAMNYDLLYLDSKCKMRAV